MNNWGVALHFEGNEVVAVIGYPQHQGSPPREGNPANRRYITELTEEQARALEQLVAAGIASGRSS